MNNYQDSKSGGKMSKSNLTRRGLLQRALVGVGFSLAGLTRARTEMHIATNPKVQSEMSVTPSSGNCGKHLRNVVCQTGCEVGESMVYTGMADELDRAFVETWRKIRPEVEEIILSPYPGVDFLRNL